MKKLLLRLFSQHLSGLGSTVGNIFRALCLMNLWVWKDVVQNLSNNWQFQRTIEFGLWWDLYLGTSKVLALCVVLLHTICPSYSFIPKNFILDCLINIFFIFSESMIPRASVIAVNWANRLLWAFRSGEKKTRYHQYKLWLMVVKLWSNGKIDKRFYLFPFCHKKVQKLVQKMSIYKSCKKKKNPKGAFLKNTYILPLYWKNMVCFILLWICCTRWY